LNRKSNLGGRDRDLDLHLESVPLTGKRIRVPLRLCELLGKPSAQKQNPLVRTQRLGPLFKGQFSRFVHQLISIAIAIAVATTSHR